METVGERRGGCALNEIHLQVERNATRQGQTKFPTDTPDCHTKTGWWEFRRGIQNRAWNNSTPRKTVAALGPLQLRSLMGSPNKRVTSWQLPPFTAAGGVLCFHGASSRTIQWLGESASRLHDFDDR